MENLLLWIGRVAGVLGVLICAAAILVRLAGTYSLGPFQIGTVLQGGMAAMLLGCLCYVANLAERMRQ